MSTVDRDAARRLGIDQTAIDNMLYDGFGQRQVANIYAGLNQYHVVMGVAPQYAGAPEALSAVYLPTGGTPQAAAPSGTNTCQRQQPRRLDRGSGEHRADRR